MSEFEHSSDKEQHLESLRRYAEFVGRMRSEHEDTARLRQGARMELSQMVDMSSTDGIDARELLEFFAGQEQHSDEELIVAYRLMPLKMIQHGNPQLRQLTPEHVELVFDLVMKDETEHTAGCYDEWDSGDYSPQCETSTRCPSKEACYEALRLLEYLFTNCALSWGNKAETELVISCSLAADAATEQMKRYQLLPDENIDFLTTHLHERALRFADDLRSLDSDDRL